MTETNDDAPMVMESKPEDAPQEHKETEENGGDAVDAVMSETGDEESKSALRANIDNKGKNAYYFAHANTASGPKWDGKAEPKLLGKSEIKPGSNAARGNTMISRSYSSFDQSSSIKSYAFVDEERKVKLYVTIPNLLVDYPNEEDIVLESTSQSFELSLYRVPPAPASAISEEGPEGELMQEDAQQEDPEVEQRPQGDRICDKRLAFSKLNGPVEKVTMKKKSDKIILTFTKAEEVAWPCIGSKE